MVSGRSARTIRNFSLELSQDLVLPNVGQVDFHDFRKHWNFNVLEMVLKTLRFVQGLPTTPSFLFLRYFRARFPQVIARASEISKYENLKIGKPRFANKRAGPLMAA